MRKLLIGLFKNVIRACLKRNEDPVELFDEALKGKKCTSIWRYMRRVFIR